MFILPTIPMSLKTGGTENSSMEFYLFEAINISSWTLRQVTWKSFECMHRPQTMQHIWTELLQKQPWGNSSVLSWGKARCTDIIFNWRTSAETIVFIYKRTQCAVHWPTEAQKPDIYCFYGACALTALLSCMHNFI